MGEIPYNLVLGMARMDDEQFKKWAERFGFTPKPGNTSREDESVSEFRFRVIHSLEFLAQEIERLENG